MRIAASGLVAFSAAMFALVGGCSDRKSGGLPPASEWQPPAGASGAVPEVVESAEEKLARCAAVAFVDDATRDGNLPSAVLEELDGVPDPQAIVLLQALDNAAGRLPNPDQQAMIMAEVALRLVERGAVEQAKRPLKRAGFLATRPGANDLRPIIAVSAIGRAWGRLGDPDAIRLYGGDPVVAPHLARGLAEGGHDQLADDLVRDIAGQSTVDPFASAELAVTDLIRGRVEAAKRRVAAMPGDWRAVHALILATAAVERKHSEAPALLAQAIALAEREQPGPSMLESLAELSLALGDAAGSARLRARMRATAARQRDPRDARAALYRLHVLATRAGSLDEAREVLVELEASGAAPWILTLARAEGLVMTGELKAAIEEVARLAIEANPPRGVIYVEVLMRYLSSARDPALERWLTDHICE